MGEFAVLWKRYPDLSAFFHPFLDLCYIYDPYADGCIVMSATYISNQNVNTVYMLETIVV